MDPRYISFDGGEGSGKSTQARLAHKYLLEKGINAMLVREPGGTFEAEAIRKVLLDPKYNLLDETELFLMEACRSELIGKKVIPYLEKGIWVVSDRSHHSTDAYQGHARGIDLGLIKRLNDFATFGRSPDLSFLINIDPTIGLSKQINQDRIGFEDLEFHSKVNEGFSKVSKKYNKTCIAILYHEGNIDLMQTKIRYHIKHRFKI